MGSSLAVLTTFWFELIDCRGYLDEVLRPRIFDHGFFLTLPDSRILDPLVVA